MGSDCESPYQFGGSIEPPFIEAVATMVGAGETTGFGGSIEPPFIEACVGILPYNDRQSSGVQSNPPSLKRAAVPNVSGSKLVRGSIEPPFIEAFTQPTTRQTIRPVRGFNRTPLH